MFHVSVFAQSIKFNFIENMEQQQQDWKKQKKITQHNRKTNRLNANVDNFLCKFILPKNFWRVRTGRKEKTHTHSKSGRHNFKPAGYKENCVDA